MTDIVKLHQQPKGAKPTFCDTPTAAAILGLLRYCHQNSEIGLVVGVPGIGKTEALKHYAASAERTWLITANETARRLTPFMLLACEVMDRPLSNRGAPRCWKSIVDLLKQCADDAATWDEFMPPLLIVDEAGFLDDQPLDALRSIHDETGCGLVLCGNPDFRARLSGTVGTARFTQLTSRIGMRLNLTMPADGDVAALCDHFDIGDARARKFLETIAERERGLRSVVRLIRTARAYMGDGRAIGRQDLERAHMLLGGDE